MKVLELNLSEPTLSRLQQAAERLGLSPEQLAVLSLEERFEQVDAALETDAKFKSTAEYVLEKNAELYKRLA